MNYQRELKNNCKPSKPLKTLTTFKIGGKARYFAEPAGLKDLRLLLTLARQLKIRILILGAGSNLLIDERGVNALVIRLGSPYFKKMVFKGNTAEAGAGVALAELISAAGSKGLGGDEFLAGIPGTIGGAVVMNAGQAQGGLSIGDLIDRLRVMDYNGNVKIIPARGIKFGYRSSGLDKYIILGAFLKFKKARKDKIRRVIKECLKRRRQSQDLVWPSAGCAFRNPLGDSAGRLIDSAGLKGRRIGGAEVSRKHANFIINRRCATSRDVLKLIRLVQERVKKRFQVELVPELKIWKP